MPDLEFAGPALPLTEADIAEAARSLGVESALIAAVAEVESAGAGFLPDGRPVILFERHVFSRETAHRHDAMHPDISNPSRGGYGRGGAHQYGRLHRAIALDRVAALRSASWGRFQIMGFNASVCGFPSVEAFVQAMTRGEAEHLKAFIAFCQANDLIRHLVVHNFPAFTRGFNGEGQVEYYAGRLKAAYTKHAAGLASTPPVDGIKAVQVALRDAGTYRAAIDGAFGRQSREALNELLRRAGQPGI